MARDRLAAMRAQQASATGGYTSPDAGVSNNGFGDHMFPTQQSTGVPYTAPSDAAESTSHYKKHSSLTSQQAAAASYRPTSGVYQAPPTAPAQSYEMQSVAAPAAMQPTSGHATAGVGAPASGYATSGATAPAGGYATTGSAAPTSGYATAGVGAPASGYAAGAGAASGGAAPPGSYAVDMSGAHDNTFFGQISQIQDAIREIDQNVNRISDLHSRSLNNVGEAAQMAAEQELTGVAQQTSTLTNKVKNSIKALEQEATKMPAGAAPDGVDRNVRLTQIGAAKNRFKETILRYQEVEKAYRTKYRQRTERQLRIVKPDATQTEIQSALDGEQGGQQIFAQALMSSNRQGEAQGALREVQERHTDIQRIERTITELAALFQEMSILVEQQDEQLNVIKDHAYHTEQEVQAGYVGRTDSPVASRPTRPWWPRAAAGSAGGFASGLRVRTPTHASDLDHHHYRRGRRCRVRHGRLQVRQELGRDEIVANF